MKQSIRAAAAACLAVACGAAPGRPATETDGGGANERTPGTMTARIDGQPFTASTTLTSAEFFSAFSESVVIGTGPAGNEIVLFLYNIGAPGTYRLGVAETNFGGEGAVSETNFGDGGAVSESFWLTDRNGAAGTVTIGALTARRITGTFSFVARDIDHASNRTVTDGVFDVPFDIVDPGAVQPYQGSAMSASIDGTSWNAAEILVSSKSAQFFADGAYAFAGAGGPSFEAGGGHSPTYLVALELRGFGGPGTYSLGGRAESSLMVGMSESSVRWTSSEPGSSGSVVVTTVDSDRLRGTFSATVGGDGGTALQLSDGTFDIGLGRP